MNYKLTTMFERKYTLYIKHKNEKDFGFSKATNDKQIIDKEIAFIKSCGNIEYKLITK